MNFTITRLLLCSGFVLTFSTLQAQDSTYNYDAVDRIPVFEGCEDKAESGNEILMKCFESTIMQYVVKNFRYPDLARENGVTGRIYVNFVIMEDASIDSVEVVKSAAADQFFLFKKRKERARLLDKEAERVVKELPIKEPAIVDDEYIRMSFTLPIYANLK